MNCILNFYQLLYHLIILFLLDEEDFHFFLLFVSQFPFSHLYDTIGSDKFDKKVKLNDGNEIKLVFWDTSGQERFRAAALITLKTVEGIILVFDITDKNSFNNIERWFKDVKDSCVKEPIIILFGNKVELDKEIWKVSMEEIEGLVKKYNWDYFLISAKNNISIEQGFNCIANKIYNKRIKK